MDGLDARLKECVQSLDLTGLKISGIEAAKVAAFLRERCVSVYCSFQLMASLLPKIRNNDVAGEIAMSLKDQI
jgi:hypothetical protein